MNTQKDGCQNKEPCVESDIFERRLQWLQEQQSHWAEQAAIDQKSAFVMFRFFLWTYLQRQKMKYMRFQGRILAPFGLLMALLRQRRNSFKPHVIDETVSDKTVNPNVGLTGAEPRFSAERPVERRVGGERRKGERKSAILNDDGILNIFAGCELTDEAREELERKREEAIRKEMGESSAA